MVDIKQSVPVCLAFSALGGILEVLATALLAYPDKKEKEGITWSPASLRLALVGNVTLQILASLFGNLLGPWFGPVSLVGPIFLSAQLLANMIVYGFVLGLENFTKDMRVGTQVVVVGAVLLPVVGPTVQEDQDIVGLLTTPYSIAWSAILLVGMFATAIFLALDVTKFESDLYRYAVLLIARCTAFTVNLTVSKMMVLKPQRPDILGIAISLKIVSGAIYTYAIIVQSTAVPQGRFVPLNAALIMAVNAVTGVVMWEDWRVVQSWLGNACVFVLLGLGNYLLLGKDSDVELFTADNRRYGRAYEFQRLSHIRRLDYQPSNRLIDIGEEESSTGEDNSEYVPPDVSDIKGKRDDQRPPPMPSRRESSVVAWRLVYSRRASSLDNQSSRGVSGERSTPRPNNAARLQSV